MVRDALRRRPRRIAKLSRQLRQRPAPHGPPETQRAQQAVFDDGMARLLEGGRQRQSPQAWLAFGFLLLCLVNTVGLLLAKFSVRAAEVGIRRALGASRKEIFRQFLI